MTAGSSSYRHPVRLALAVTVIALLLVGANLATPVYLLIQADLGLSPFAVTVAFSSYVLALIVITYLGSAVPVLGLGAAAGVWGLTASVTVYSFAVAGLCAVLAAGSLVLRLRTVRRGVPGCL